MKDIPMDISGKEINLGDKVRPIGPYLGSPSFIVDSIKNYKYIGWRVCGYTKSGDRSNEWNALYLSVVYSATELVPNPM